MELASFFDMNLLDPVVRAAVRNDCFLRSYQTDTLRTIFNASMSGRGGRYAVTFPRQSGKNETQAQLESAVMSANLWRGGNIVKIIPTEKNQGKISTERLSAVLPYTAGTVQNINNENVKHTDRLDSNRSDNGSCPDSSPKGNRSISANEDNPSLNISGNFYSSFSVSRLISKKDEVRYGSTTLRCLSAGKKAAIVGATADLLLEVDEAQMVSIEKYDREAAPMAASTNAVQVFWGTAWDDQTLLSRETRFAYKEGDNDQQKHVFQTTAAEVSREVPAYGDFVRDQISRLGREHPVIRTQFFCEEITDLTTMFHADRINKMKGKHESLNAPEKDRCYVFLIDVAGSDEITSADKKAGGFSDRRDATVVTICDVSLPKEQAYDPKNFVWKVVGRRLYRNMRTELLKNEIFREIDIWNPFKIIIDHSGMGAMLSGILMSQYKSKVFPVDITMANKTKMAWDFLAMIDTGRWQEYKCISEDILSSDFKPGMDCYELLREPELLQQMFFRELRACRIEPTGSELNVRWGVRDGARDPATGRILHDDLVMSAALAVFESGNLPICTVLPEWDPSKWRNHKTYRRYEENQGWKW